MKKYVEPQAKSRSIAGSTLKNYLYAKGLSDNTVTSYHTQTLSFIAWLDGEGIETQGVTSADITAYLNHLKKKGNANFTRSIQLNILKHFFDYEIEQGRRENNPTQHLKIRGSKRKILYPTLSKQELENIYYQYEVPKTDDPRANRNWFTKYRLSRQRNKVILGLMVWQGLITPEINKLTLQDVKLKEGKIYIAGGRKTAEKILELKPQQIVELMEYQFSTRNELLKFYPEPAEGTGKNRSDTFFISVPAAGQSKIIADNTINAWKRLTQEVEKLNPRFINFKQVRTSVITHWLAQYNLRQVQYMAGHKYASTTESYRVNQVEDLQADIEQYHPIY